MHAIAVGVEFDQATRQELLASIHKPSVSLSKVNDVESVDKRDDGQYAAEQSVGVALDAVEEVLRDIVQHRVQVFRRNFAQVGRNVVEQLLGRPGLDIRMPGSQVRNNFVNNLLEKKEKKVLFCLIGQLSNEGKPIIFFFFQ